MGESQAIVLQRLLPGLKSEDSTTRLSTLRELSTLSYGSRAILQALESITIHDPDETTRRLARDLLGNSTYRYIRQTTSALNRDIRKILLGEIATWQKEGLVPEEQAQVLGARYNFDMASVKPSKSQEPAEASLPPTLGTPAPPVATSQIKAEPRLSLSQRLLSQATVNVFLYLGAFLVIGAALILAALVQAARLPILSGVSVVFAAGALALRKRLPQPSFALFIVFSFLMPILARVLGESLHLSGSLVYAYWSVILLFTAAIWAFSTWFYLSRLFSMASFVSLVLGSITFARIFTISTDWITFAVEVATFLGLCGVTLLTLWKRGKFRLPLTFLLQATQASVLLLSMSSAVIHLFDSSNVAGSDWLGVTLTWLAAAAFYLGSSLLFQFPLFPWASVAALVPAAWFLPRIFNAGEAGWAASYWAWAAALAAGSELLSRRGSAKARSFSLPAALASMVLFASAAISGLLWVLAGAAVVYAILHIIRPRLAFWTAALLFGLAAYLRLFALPILASINVPWSYRLLGAGLLLALPELFLKFPGGPSRSWRVPLLVLGALVALATVGAELLLLDGSSAASICFGIYALIFVGYGLHFRRPALGYLATAFAALFMLYRLWPVKDATWLTIFTGLSILYYAAGFVLRMQPRTRDWASVLRISGLVLGAISAGAAMVSTVAPIDAAYLVAIAGMYLAETYIRPDDRLEFGAPVLLSAAAAVGLPHDQINDWARLLLVISLIWLFADQLFARTLNQRRLSILTRLAGLTIALGNASLLLLGLADPGLGTLCFAVYALFAAFDSWFYRQPLLGYVATATLPLSLFFGLRMAGQQNWLFSIAALAAIYYAIGYLLRSRDQLRDWRPVFLFSGLGLATINALSAPFQTGLQAAIPVAIAATLFAIEAFALSSVWLGFPANLLYLEAYFLILVSLKVDQPQFYSVGAALLGILMHYLLTRAGSRTGAFLTGILSQLVLLGTTYIQLFSTEQLGFFVVLFFQALVMLAYGIFVRSRSLVITPIVFIVLSVITVVYSALKGISTVIMIGCSGILLLLLGILAVVLRERLSKLGDQWNTWKA